MDGSLCGGTHSCISQDARTQEAQPAAGMFATLTFEPLGGTAQDRNLYTFGDFGLGLSLCSAAPPTPTSSSSVEQVEEWLTSFAAVRKGRFGDVEQLVGTGSDLLSFTEEECLRRSPRWGDMIYNALLKAPSTPEGAFWELLSVNQSTYLSINLSICLSYSTALVLLLFAS